MDNYSIKDIEAISGIKAHTIRMWEQRYNFLKPCRTSTNIRYYSCEELKKLLNVSILNKHGYKISHIECMCLAEMEEKILSLNTANAGHERTMIKLLNEMVDKNAENFEKILDKQIAQYGMEKTILEIVYPFLEKTGITWKSCCLGLTEHHLVTPIIRQKLVVAIDGVVSQNKTTKSFLLFLPEGEQQELGILFIYYLLKRKGMPVIYLGANVPVNDVAYVSNLKKPGTIITHIISKISSSGLQKIINELNKSLFGPEVFISISSARDFKRKLPGHFHLKPSLSEIVNQFSLS